MMDFFFNDVQDQFIDAGVVVFAALLAGLVGNEREHSDKPTGFRTHMLVSGAAALLVLLIAAGSGRWSLRNRDWQ